MKDQNNDQKIPLLSTDFINNQLYINNKEKTGLIRVLWSPYRTYTEETCVFLRSRASRDEYP